MSLNLELLSDEDLLKILAEDQPEALNTLYQRHAGKVYAYALKRLPNQNLAEEVTQQVFFQLFNKRKQYNPEYLALQWIFVITRSEANDCLKRERRHLNHQDINEYAESLSQNQESAPFQLERATLDLLSPESRKAIEMRYFQDKEFNEIALALGKSETNVRQIISRATRKLKSLFLKKVNHESN